MNMTDTYRSQFRFYKMLADKAIAQIEESDLFLRSSAYENSIAIIMGHMAGNMLSRWTDFLESDGEKSWRDRESEFEQPADDVFKLHERWDKGWNCLYDALDQITDDDLSQIIYIRNMGCTVHDAIIRQISHYAYHVGQIVWAVKAIQKDNFDSLSIPRGQSQKFNAARFDKAREIKSFMDDVEK